MDTGSKIDIYLETDASKAGWRGNLNGKIIGGRWSRTEPVSGTKHRF